MKNDLRSAVAEAINTVEITVMQVFDGLSAVPVPWVTLSDEVGNHAQTDKNGVAVIGLPMDQPVRLQAIQSGQFLKISRYIMGEFQWDVELSASLQKVSLFIS